MYGHNRALNGAYNKGRRARADGKALHENPYPDHRTWQNKLTWSRAFRTAWQNGWKDADKELSQDVDR